MGRSAEAHSCRSDEDLLRTVESARGGVGILEVYSISSSVEFLRMDGKLPLDAGLTFKGI